MSVHVDGVEQFSGIAAPDTLLEYNALSEVRVAAANAMALDVIWNGQPQGQIGGRGQRADIHFTATEAIVELGPAGAPTPLSPTAEVVTVAAVLEPTATEGPSPTPTETLDSERHANTDADVYALANDNADPERDADSGSADGDFAAAGDAGGFAADEGGRVMGTQWDEFDFDFDALETELYSGFSESRSRVLQLDFPDESLLQLHARYLDSRTWDP